MRVENTDCTTRVGESAWKIFPRTRAPFRRGSESARASEREATRCPARRDETRLHERREIVPRRERIHTATRRAKAVAHDERGESLSRQGKAGARSGFAPPIARVNGEHDKTSHTARLENAWDVQRDKPIREQGVVSRVNRPTALLERVHNHEREHRIKRS